MDLRQKSVSARIYRGLLDAAECKTFSDVLMQMRIDEARMLLAHTPMSISEISERVGFASTTAFARFFTRACGAPPARYRGRCRV
ncbi:helix-turn-helix transcriptional regulator [Paraburkholderia sp. 40]|uniref:helix-turn-helix transcriptional regulator n=1 Tax=Paraburkholderia sp. 40 TaxID=2991059 RepID=UPI003D1D819E